eukprot:5971485-Alexandrium_andersonii.AAC.1
MEPPGQRFAYSSALHLAHESPDSTGVVSVRLPPDMGACARGAMVAGSMCADKMHGCGRRVGIGGSRANLALARRDGPWARPRQASGKRQAKCRQ